MLLPFPLPFSINPITVVTTVALILLTVSSLWLNHSNNNLRAKLSTVVEQSADCRTTLETTISKHNQEIDELSYQAKQRASENAVLAQRLSSEAKRYEGLSKRPETVVRMQQPSDRLSAIDRALNAHMTVVKP